MHNYWLFDLFLGFTALLVASQYWSLSRTSFSSTSLMMVAALLLIALAAFVGAYRYGINPGVTELHRALSQLSGLASFLLIGIALVWTRLFHWGLDKRAAVYGAVVVVLALSIGLAESGLLAPQRGAQLGSLLGLLLWLLVALLEWVSPRRLTRAQILLLGGGALLVAVNGLLIGTGALRLLGLARTNWFHLLLAISLLSLLCARPLFSGSRAK